MKKLKLLGFLMALLMLPGVAMADTYKLVTSVSELDADHDYIIVNSTTAGAAYGLAKTGTTFASGTAKNLTINDDKTITYPTADGPNIFNFVKNSSRFALKYTGENVYLSNAQKSGSNVTKPTSSKSFWRSTSLFDYCDWSVSINATTGEATITNVVSGRIIYFTTGSTNYFKALTGTESSTTRNPVYIYKKEVAETGPKKYGKDITLTPNGSNITYGGTSYGNEYEIGGGNKFDPWILIPEATNVSIDQTAGNPTFKIGAEEITLTLSDAIDKYVDNNPKNAYLGKAFSLNIPNDKLLKSEAYTPNGSPYKLSIPSGYFVVTVDGEDQVVKAFDANFYCKRSLSFIYKSVAADGSTVTLSMSGAEVDEKVGNETTTYYPTVVELNGTINIVSVDNNNNTVSVPFNDDYIVNGTYVIPVKTLMDAANNGDGCPTGAYTLNISAGALGWLKHNAGMYYGAEDSSVTINHQGVTPLNITLTATEDAALGTDNGTYKYYAGRVTEADGRTAYGIPTLSITANGPFEFADDRESEATAKLNYSANGLSDWTMMKEFTASDFEYDEDTYTATLGSRALDADDVVLGGYYQLVFDNDFIIADTGYVLQTLPVGKFHLLAQPTENLVVETVYNDDKTAYTGFNLSFENFDRVDVKILDNVELRVNNTPWFKGSGKMTADGEVVSCKFEGTDGLDININDAGLAVWDEDNNRYLYNNRFENDVHIGLPKDVISAIKAYMRDNVEYVTVTDPIDNTEKTEKVITKIFSDENTILPAGQTKWNTAPEGEEATPKKAGLNAITVQFAEAGNLQFGPNKNAYLKRDGKEVFTWNTTDHRFYYTGRPDGQFYSVDPADLTWVQFHVENADLIAIPGTYTFEVDEEFFIVGGQFSKASSQEFTVDFPDDDRFNGDITLDNKQVFGVNPLMVEMEVSNLRVNPNHTIVVKNGDEVVTPQSITTSGNNLLITPDYRFLPGVYTVEFNLGDVYANVGGNIKYMAPQTLGFAISNFVLTPGLDVPNHTFQFAFPRTFERGPELTLLDENALTVIKVTEGDNGKEKETVATIPAEKLSTNFGSIYGNLPALDAGTYELRLASGSVELNYAGVKYVNYGTAVSAEFTLKPFKDGITLGGFSEAENTCSVVANTYDQEVYVIPSTIDYLGTEYTVTSIADEAFKGQLIRDLYIPSSITSIGKDAFAGSNIEKLVFLPREKGLTFDENGVGVTVLLKEIFFESDANINLSAFSKGNAQLDTQTPIDVYVPTTSNFSISDSQFIVHKANIINGTETKKELIDGFEYACAARNGHRNVEVTYKRNFNVAQGAEGNWQALFLPHPVNAENIGGTVIRLKSVRQDNETGKRYVVWEKVENEDLLPNTPYMFKANGKGDAAHTFTGVGAVHHSAQGVVKAATDDTVENGFSVTITGVYAPFYATVGDGKYYLFSDGNFKMTGKDQWLKPFRVYLTVKDNVAAASQNPAPLYNVLDNGTDTPTAIGVLPYDVLESGVYYDLQGNKVVNPEPGIYILNGKKVVIK